MNQVETINAILLWIAILFNLLLILTVIRKLPVASYRSNAFRDIEDEDMFLKPGQVAPNSTAQTLEGKPVTLSDYLSQATALIFLAPNCESCREKVPYLQKLNRRLKDLHSSLVLILDSDLEGANSFVNETQVTLPVLSASYQHSSLLKEYKIRRFPSYCLLRSDGLVYSSGGLLPLRRFHAVLESWQRESKGLSVPGSAITEGR